MELNNKGHEKYIQSYGFYKNRPRINFVRPQEEQTESREKIEEKGSVSSFYYSLFSEDVKNLDKSAANNARGSVCPACQIFIEAENQITHAKSVRHLLSVNHIDNKYQPGLVKPGSLGYRVLSQFGWSPKGHVSGLGAEHQGRRAPVRHTRVKNDNLGIGVQLRPNRPKPVSRKGKRHSQIQHKRDVRLKQALLKHFSSNN
ncbi:RNA-binding protein, G-patch type, GPANK1-like protein [Schizosaccharomyces osmophilus]|uniref:RNA-binding protein, G-patch type, GPANK1-like protein n=1 Tax=Schizosaccharomyces osmophilus TaxID=2545709 RepID=A0AAE9W7W8_9SCHI|nr:RNA-binding protein, G-patch type, GPANK1-like protein [Schizosaccharomyces osmophilus]WBW71384.1 RNA-binding protein, G-patch type, GPANK1-like protein [Schizosaccharomyces osmophilus]